VVAADTRQTKHVTSTPSPNFTRRAALGLGASALALAACGGSDAVVNDESPATDAAEDSAAAAEPQGLQQNGPITVTGDLLDPFDSSIDDLSIGVVAPLVAGESFDGSAITLGGPTEKPTFIVFLAHWCSHCNDEVPVLIGLENYGRMPANLDVIGVSTSVAADRDNFPPSDWIADKGWPWPTIADSEELGAINAMGGTSFPFVVVLDTDGTVLARRSGGRTADVTLEFLEAALATANA
jgi:cytochrome c biogenesis protein CcmG/thiol:disulfide interchange protein DsbE